MPAAAARRPASTRGTWDLWIANADGAAAKQLTTEPGTEGSPNVSADGSRLSYVSDQSGEFDVWVSNVDGSNQRQLSKGGGYDPHFTAAGDVAYRTSDGTAVKAFRVPIGGGSSTPIFPDATRLPPGFEFHALSPDGRLALGHYTDREARGLERRSCRSTTSRP